MSFTSLSHHIDLEWLREAYRRTRKDGAPGVDGQTAADYEQHLEDNLQSLLSRVKSGTYRAPPVRRVQIPKDNGETRPLGIPTFEDKVLQRAMVMVLEPIYEQDFLDCSYGFRPGRSPHQALSTIRETLMSMKGGVVLEVDLRKFFDSLDHEHLRTILNQRVRDGVVIRCIGKWLNAGILEDQQLSYPESGTPQGGVISPLLANVFLHEVIDRWFEQQIKPQLKGRAHLIRYADDLVMIFAREDDAQRVYEVLPKRLGRYGLTLHPEKTRLISFWRPAYESEQDSDRQPPEPGTFDFLGFTHHWARSRRGFWVVKRRTSRVRFSRSVRRMSAWLRENRHRPLREQWARLCAKLRGYFGYYGITGNAAALSRFHRCAENLWLKWLRRRGQKAFRSWQWYQRILVVFPLPPPIAVHSELRRVVNP